jgi:uncharacterized Zn finger protein
MKRREARHIPAAEVAMQCVRCTGLRVAETMQDGGMRVLAYRCVHCGDIVDPKILLNRHHRPVLQPSRPRTPNFHSLLWKRRTA